MPFPEGATVAPNLGAFCRRHHRFKQSGGGPRVSQPEPGRFVWRMPTGHRYTVDAPALTDPGDDGWGGPAADGRVRGPT